MQNTPGIRVYVWRASAKLASVRAELPFHKDRGLQVAKPQCIKLLIFVRDVLGFDVVGGEFSLRFAEDSES